MVMEGVQEVKGVQEACSAENDRAKVLGRRAFALTYAVSLIVHSARKSYSCIKPALLDEDWLSVTSGVKGREGLLLAVPDSSFLLCYGIFIVIGGRAADMFDARLIMSAALLSTAVFLFMFALGGVLQVHTLVFFAVIWGLHGLTQSPAWPACVSTMGRWYSKGVRGGVMGWWSSSANVGNLAATALSSVIFALMGTRHTAWSMLMGILGVVTLVILLLVYCFLVPEPIAEGRAQPDRRLTPDTRWDNDLSASFLEKNSVEASDGHEGDAAPRALSLFRALCLPGVLEVGAAYGALKGCSYALFFWLPVFLRLKTGVAVQQANSIAMVFDVGQVIGALGGGHLSDKLLAPLTVNLVFLLSSALPLYFLGSSGTSLPTLVILLILAGCLSGGPQNLIATVVSQDLGQSPTIKGNARALATVAAVIDGMGSLGAAGMQYLVGSLFPCTGNHSVSDDEKSDCDWRPMFLLLTMGQVFASLLLLRHAVKELSGRSSAPSDDGRDTPELEPGSEGE